MTTLDGGAGVVAVGYRVLAEATMLAHFAFLAFLVTGGYLAWWRRWLIVPHALTAGWGLLSVTVGVECPLTLVEDWARRNAGEQGLGRGFIDTYLTGVIYPQEHLLAVQLLVAVLVGGSWLGLALGPPVRQPRPVGLGDSRS